MIAASLSLLMASVMAVPVPTMVTTTIPSSGTAATTCIPISSTRNATVVMLGMHGGTGAPAPFALLGDLRKPRTVAITGRGRGKVVLVVSAIEPTLWDVSAIRNRVQAVVASGRFPQAVAGLDKTKPIHFSSTFGGSAELSATCSPIRYAYATTGDIRQMAAEAERVVGRHPRRFYGGIAPNGFNIDGGETTAPRIPRLDEIRAGVPIASVVLPEPASRSGYGPDTEPPSPATRIVEWDQAGRLIRNEGTVIVTDVNLQDRVAPNSSQSRGPLGNKTFFLLILIGSAGLWLLRRCRYIPTNLESRAELLDPRWRVPPEQLAVQSPLASRSSFPDSQLAELSALAAVTESETLVIALHRYGRELRTIVRTPFDVDLTDEIKAIVERHFAHALRRYRAARPSLEGEEADHADATLTRALERLTSRLHELQSEQHQRDMDGIDEAARFIDSRHPK